MKRRIGRFERKVLLTIVAVAIAPLVGALVLGRAVLRDAYQVGVNERIGEQLHRGVEVQRTHIVLLRERAERTADAIAGSAVLRDLLEAGQRSNIEAHLDEQLERYPSIAALRVASEDDVEVAAAARESRISDDVRELRLEREVLTADTALTVTTVATAPASIFEDFQQAGAQAEVYTRLESQSGYISQVYLGVYVGFLALVIAVAFLVAVVVARRFTQRVTSLAEATRRLGRGDLDVVVPRESRDEVGELVDAFNTMVRDLKRSRERIDYLKRISAWQDFARRLAHEIKNPLTPIQLAAQELERTYDGEDERFRRKLGDAAEIISEEVETLRRLVSEFSSFAKLPAADLDDADLAAFVADFEGHVPAILSDVLGPTDVRVEVDVNEDALPVRIDAMMLRLCVDNLVRNALQAIRDDGGSMVRVSARREGMQALIIVDDDGPGIPEDRQETVFDPYVTGKHDGTGLGLAIVKKVILEHDGHIECGTSDAGGACFTIRLPMSDS